MTSRVPLKWLRQAYFFTLMCTCLALLHVDRGGFDRKMRPRAHKQCDPHRLQGSMRSNNRAAGDLDCLCTIKNE